MKNQDPPAAKTPSCIHLSLRPGVGPHAVLKICFLGLALRFVTDLPWMLMYDSWLAQGLVLMVKCVLAYYGVPILLAARIKKLFVHTKSFLNKTFDPHRPHLQNVALRQQTSPEPRPRADRRPAPAHRLGTAPGRSRSILLFPCLRSSRRRLRDGDSVCRFWAFAECPFGQHGIWQLAVTILEHSRRSL